MGAVALWSVPTFHFEILATMLLIGNPTPPLLPDIQSYNILQVYQCPYARFSRPTLG